MRLWAILFLVLGSERREGRLSLLLRPRAVLGRKGDTEGAGEYECGQREARRPGALCALGLRAGGDGLGSLEMGQLCGHLVLVAGEGPRIPGYRSQRGSWEGHCWLLREPFQECGRA